MSPDDAFQQTPQACTACLARAGLLALLSARIEHAAIDADRLMALLALQDEQLIEAIGGRKRDQLHQHHRQLRSEAALPSPSTAICQHDRLHKRIFGAVSESIPAPAVLYVSNDARRLATALDRPIVALLGTARASDYGMEMACFLARSLTRSGVGVISSFTAGIPAAVHLGVLEASGAPLAVGSSGLDTCRPGHLRRLRARLLQSGLLLSEMPCGFRGRRWSDRASERILAAIASLVIVIESDRSAGMLAARLARNRGMPVGALPGRITSPHSRGPHQLLREGAALIASPQDALDLLYGLNGPDAEQPLAHLSPTSVRLLERIGSGEDAHRCLGDRFEGDLPLAELSELRSAGLLARGDDGSYLPRVSLDERCAPSCPPPAPRGAASELRRSSQAGNNPVQ